MIDLHAHILPEIDDGSKNIEMSLEMLRIAVRDGITDIAATPHFISGDLENTKRIVEAKIEQLKSAAAENEIMINIYPGNEVFLSPEVPRMLKEGIISSLNGSRYLLVELPMAMVPGYTEDVLYEIRLLGYTPIIAHPERNGVLGNSPEVLKSLIRQGALSQVNSTSITGIFGKRIRKSALNLIHMGLVHLVSSDAHTTRNRAPVLKEARKLVVERFGEETARILFDKNGEQILKDGQVAELPAKLPSKGFGIGSRFLKDIFSAGFRKKTHNSSW